MADNSADDPTAFRFRVTGRVQGVNFRAWTRREAEALGLAGWVRNERDGAVTGLVAGPGPAVQRMLDALRRGPPLARVDGLDVEPAPPPVTRGFEIRR